MTATPLAISRTNPASPESRPLDQLLAELAECFGAEFWLWDSLQDIVVNRDGRPVFGDELFQAEMARSVRQAEQPQLIDETACATLLALPVKVPGGATVVAMAAFAVGVPLCDAHLDSTARLLGRDCQFASRWLADQPLWTPQSLLRLARTFLGRYAAESESCQLRHELNDFVENLAFTYEEISLLQALTSSLRLTVTEEELARLVVDRLVDCFAVEGVSVLLLAGREKSSACATGSAGPRLVTAGHCPLGAHELEKLVEYIGESAHSPGLVINRGITEKPDWPFPSVESVVLSRLADGGQTYGWLVAMNCPVPREFGSVEATLLNSIGGILGMHHSDRRLYRERAELLANVIKALASAIDAKDPYTKGHSDRVGYTAVRLAQKLGCDEKSLETIYLAGLLHDIGKIGVDDAVLRKDGRLTPEETNHIQQHPTLGHKILADLRPLADILPAVLHHHEQWNGGGYPDHLAGETIPWIARVISVADAYDAMTSDRPYRRGLPRETVLEILRKGAGVQWDPQLINAFLELQSELAAEPDKPNEGGSGAATENR